jgi:hypothetical protein
VGPVSHFSSTEQKRCNSSRLELLPFRFILAQQNPSPTLLCFDSHVSLLQPFMNGPVQQSIAPGARAGAGGKEGIDLLLNAAMSGTSEQSGSESRRGGASRKKRPPASFDAFAPTYGESPSHFIPIPSPLKMPNKRRKVCPPPLSLSLSLSLSRHPRLSAPHNHALLPAYMLSTNLVDVDPLRPSP